MLPSVSVPTPIAARLAAIAAPVPELDPHGLRSSTYGFFVWPPRELQPDVERVERKFAHSLRFVLPRITAPASRRRATMNASCFGPMLGERQRAGGVHHAGDVDVVLDQHRDAVQRTAHLAGLALGVERFGVGQRGRIDLDHRIQRRPPIVDLRDAIEIRLRERARGQRAGRHAIARVGGAQLHDVDRPPSSRGWKLSRVGSLAGDPAQEIALNGHQARDESTHQVLLNAFAMFVSAARPFSATSPGSCACGSRRRAVRRALIECTLAFFTKNRSTIFSGVRLLASPLLRRGFGLRARVDLLRDGGDVEPREVCALRL